MAEGGVGASWNARSQRRGRPGFSPGSLFTHPAGSRIGHLGPVNGDRMVTPILDARQPVDQNDRARAESFGAHHSENSA